MAASSLAVQSELQALPSPSMPMSASCAGGSKATTDTARRILATLDALDRVVAASPPGSAAAAALGAVQQEQPAPSPPPTESLGFAGGHMPVLPGQGCWQCAPVPWVGCWQPCSMQR